LTEVVVGRAWSFAAPFEYDGAIWWAVRNRSWHRVTDRNARLGGPGDQQVTSVITRGKGFVAVGVSGAGERPTAWLSGDGRRWRAVFMDSRRGNAFEVVRAGAWLVAAGIDTDSAHPAAWISKTGGTWSRLELPAGAATFELGGQRLRIALAGGPRGELALILQNDVLSDVYIARR
jgi:hypothetical protein